MVDCPQSNNDFQELGSSEKSIKLPNKPRSANTLWKTLKTSYEAKKYDLPEYQEMIKKKEEHYNNSVDCYPQNNSGMWATWISILDKAIRSAKTKRLEALDETENQTEIEIILSNAKLVKSAIEEVRAYYDKHSKNDAYLFGSVIVLIDTDGKFIDFNHHMTPTMLAKNPDNLKQPAIFSDEVFESWHKTNQIMIRAVKNNGLLWKQASTSNLPQFTLKKTEKEPELSTNFVAQELYVVLSEGDLHTKVWVCPDIGFRPNGIQHKNLLKTINNVNSENWGSLLRYTHIENRIVCTISFLVILWDFKNGKIKSRIFTKKIKDLMEAAKRCHMEVQESGSSPLSMGLKSLIGPIKEFHKLY